MTIFNAWSWGESKLLFCVRCFSRVLRSCGRHWRCQQEGCVSLKNKRTKRSLEGFFPFVVLRESVDLILLQLGFAQQQMSVWANLLLMQSISAASKKFPHKQQLCALVNNRRRESQTITQWLSIRLERAMYSCLEPKRMSECPSGGAMYFLPMS